ncbi:MAG: TerB family tellurite resistance protein [Labilithrix sp.]|nr:TerB family tellurite resistance protein [Labilithrix sp.]MCW5813420.1 TerB family tellurite resistance protein [Labilithrix sp.]
MDAKVAKCLLVSKVLVADGIMTENERAFLDRLMKRLELDEAMRKKVIDLDGLDQAESIVAKLSLEEKQEMVTVLVDAASADGRLSPLELKVVRDLTYVLGLGDSAP